MLLINNFCIQNNYIDHVFSDMSRLSLFHQKDFETTIFLKENILIIITW